MKSFVADEYNYGLREAMRDIASFGLEAAQRLVRVSYSGGDYRSIGYRAAVQEAERKA
jgi:hypothetical protein